MKRTILFILLFISCFYFSCNKKNNSVPINSPEVISSEFQNELLFVNRPDFQIQTSEQAQFSSPDSLIDISSTGLIKRITSAEVVPIDITWLSSGNKTRIYALGATDDSFDKPYSSFHGALASDPYNSYLNGWETLRKLPSANETYAIILRHADADNGRDYSVIHDDDGPFEWWKSCDPTLARQLNAKGISRATELGTIFKDLNFPIERVTTSEFCRAVQTAQLLNTDIPIVTNGNINHPAYNKGGTGLFPGMIGILNAYPVDKKMSLVVGHHPMNELRNTTYPTFPSVSPFSWTGAYLVKVTPDKIITYEGAVSWGMFKYWRDLKLNKL